MSEPVSGTSGRSWDLLARVAAEQRDGEATPIDFLQFLTFVLDGAPYAIPVERVREIVRLRPTTPIPRVPDDVRGVISLRGEIVQVVDLRRRLGLAMPEASRSSRVIVVHGGDDQIAGLLVDGVTEVLTVGEEALRPSSGESSAVDTLCARGDEFVSLLDLDRVLAVHASE